MNLNDLFKNKGLDPQDIIVLRHRPTEPELRKVLPWLAAEKPDVFNAYQQTQTERLEKAMEKMSGSGYVASFIGLEPGSALFIGLYSIGNTKPLTRRTYWQVPAYIEMKAFGHKGLSKDSPRKKVLWFDLRIADFCVEWKGKLTVGWPPPERSWWRRAHRNTMPILSILEDSALDA
ncbi:GIY-YIG nuclease family protein, partial [Planctomycetota bacterium]